VQRQRQVLADLLEDPQVGQAERALLGWPHHGQHARDRPVGPHRDAEHRAGAQGGEHRASCRRQAQRVLVLDHRLQDGPAAGQYLGVQRRGLGPLPGDQRLGRQVRAGHHGPGDPCAADQVDDDPLRRVGLQQPADPVQGDRLAQ
jgi:hypothetical protein